MLTSYDSPFAKKGYLMSMISNKTGMLECKEAIANKEKAQKDGKTEIQGLQEKDLLIKSAMSLFENLLVIPSRPQMFGRIVNQIKISQKVRTVWAIMLWTTMLLKICSKSQTLEC